jgi:hypothetical protein
MKTLSKLVVVTSAFFALLFATSHELIHVVYIWPDGYDASGAKFWTYDRYQPETHVNTEDTVACYIEDYTASDDCIVWHSEMGNFPDWQGGDTIVALGCWDSVYARDPAGYGDNPAHTGFFWVYSDTLDPTQDPEYWTPYDTLRVMPKPLASQVGDSIEIAITNPLVTVSGITNYAVYGYWFWADTTGSGTPDKFDKEVALVPVQGGAGETTIFRHLVEGNYEDAQTVYWAYKLVAVPDTTATESRQGCPGYATYYLSQNSNPLVIIGIAETDLGPVPEARRLLQVAPNPFQDKVSIVLGAPSKGINPPGNDMSADLRIYDASGQLVKQFNHLTNRQFNQVLWNGMDDAGNKVPAGIYFVQIEADGHAEIEKVILIR